MIHVFLIIHEFSGALTYTNQLASYLSKVNDFCVYKVYLESSLKSEFCVVSKDNIKSIYIPKNIKKEFNDKYFYQASLLLYQTFENLENVIIHLNTQEQFSFGKQLKALFKCQVIFTIHYLKGFYSYMFKTCTTIKFCEDALFIDIINFSDHIICVTGFSQKIIQELYKIKFEKTSIIYNGIAIHPPKTKMIKSKYGFDQEDKLILFAGQVDPMKGLDKLIKTFLIIKDNFPTYKLIIAGLGNYDDYLPLAQECIGRIHFVGKLDKKTLFDFYTFCDVGVIPSMYEQCSYVAIEMMLHKLPLIISDVPGLNELVIHKKTGLICKTQKCKDSCDLLEISETDLIEQLTYIHENPIKVKTMADLAYKITSERNSLDSMGEKTIELYKSLMY